jgi:UDP-4-amino-4,6-dideoxy-N-acetyl-beta-L-altrosamine N-acetyltransferase
MGGDLGTQEAGMSTTSPKPIQLTLLTNLDTKSQSRIRDIRNEENVRKWMYTDHVIGPDEHLAWITRLKQDNRQIVFVVMNDERNPLGVVSVNAIDGLHKKTDWAYYLTETARGGLGSSLEFTFIDFVFGTLGMEKLNCEVIEGNDAVVKLHKRFLFQEEGVHFLGLTKEDWLTGRAGIHDQYREVFDRFSISIEWPA